MHLSDIGANYIVQALKNHVCKLKELSFYGNRVTEIGRNAVQ